MELGRKSKADPAAVTRDPWEGLAEAIDVPLERLRAALTRSNRGVALQGALVQQLRGGSNGTQASTSAGRLVGWSMRESAGVPAVVYLRDGRDSDGALLAVVSLVANETVRDWFGDAGLSVNEGLYVHVATGSVEGAVYLGASE